VSRQGERRIRRELEVVGFRSYHDRGARSKGTSYSDVLVEGGPFSFLLEEKSLSFRTLERWWQKCSDLATARGRMPALVLQSQERLVVLKWEDFLKLLREVSE